LAALAVQAFDFAPGELGGDCDLGGLHPPLGDLTGVGPGLGATGRGQRVQGLACTQALVRRQVAVFRVGVERLQAAEQRRTDVLGRGTGLRRDGGRQQQGRERGGGKQTLHGWSSVPRRWRSEATSARRWASVASAWAWALRALA